MRELHVVVLGAGARSRDPITIGDHVFAYPTTARTRAGALVEGMRIGVAVARAHAVDIVSTQDPFETALIGYLLKRAFGVRLQIQEHGDFFYQPYWRKERLLHRLRYLFGLLLMRRADCWRVVSERQKRKLIVHGFPAARIAVAPLHTNTASFADAAPDPELQALRPEGGVLILTMARLVPQKNLALLIRAFACACAAGMNARLVIIGKGPLRAELELLARSLVHGAGTSDSADRIVFRDWTDNPAAAIKAADIYTLSSDYEGWGRVCIEALAAGTPLLMTDVGCAGEVVRDGENGLVVPVRDETALAGALTRLVRDHELRVRLSTAGRATTAALPDEDAYHRQYRRSLACCDERSR